MYYAVHVLIETPRIVLVSTFDFLLSIIRVAHRFDFQSTTSITVKHGTRGLIASWTDKLTLVSHGSCLAPFFTLR